MESKYLDQVLEILNKNDGVKLNEDQHLLKGNLKEFYKESTLLNPDLVSKQTKAKDYFENKKPKLETSDFSQADYDNFRKMVLDMNQSVTEYISFF